MNGVSDAISWLVLTSWIGGVVLAKGALSTIAAIFMPPYAWYPVIERAMALGGLT